jgi:hypothetical protein
MNKKKTKLIFSIIDEGIEVFVCDKESKVASTAHSDWLIFDWRQITWTKNAYSYLIEIYPNFDDLEKIVSWNLYTAISYDSKGVRHWLPKDFASKVPLEFISKNIKELLEQAYNYIISINKEDIPVG